ncbi:MAG: phosphohistidine phosphatase SixA [Acidobacteria bacterium]|nr:MAG: phosphohistidine phosphatase SixA [Acidobacteriota bacterium]
MILYFLRHASAGQRRLNQSSDDKRPLDKEGIEQCRYVGRFLNTMDAHVDLILSSPLKRATQTAAMVGNEIAYELQIETTPVLHPSSQYERFRDLIYKIRELESVMVVGHNPNLSEFISLMVTNGLNDDVIEMKKGSVARVEVGAKRSVLNWIVTPRLIKSVYASMQVSSQPNISRK